MAETAVTDTGGTVIRPDGMSGFVDDWSSDQRAFKNVPWGKAMMWIFLLSDTFIFSCFLLSYMTVRMSTTVPWPNPSEVFALSFGGEPIPLILIAIMTFILITSSGTMVLAVNYGYRNEIVAEAPQEQRGQQVDHHDHAVHGDELIVGLGGDKIEGVREAQLQPHQPRQDQRHQSNCNRRKRILHGNDFGVLAEDIFRDEALWMVEIHFRHFSRRDVLDCGGYEIGHHITLFACPCASIGQSFTVPMRVLREPLRHR